MSDFETLLYEADDGVGWVTLNRPDTHNAFNLAMQNELAELWHQLQDDESVRCIVLTGAGEKAFCAGLDRDETMGDWVDDPDRVGQSGGTPGFGPSLFSYDDPGIRLGPKANDLWKPVIGAVNGMACAGAFYLLGEVDFIIAADHATFFDPHVTYGMPAVFEPIHMLQKMPSLTLWMFDRWCPPHPDEPYASSGSLHARITLDQHRSNLASCIDVQDEYHDRCGLVRYKSPEVAAWITDNMFDVVFIDGDHEEEAAYELRGALICTNPCNLCNLSRRSFGEGGSVD